MPPKLDADSRLINQVMEILRERPADHDLNTLVETFAQLGWFAAGLAAMAERAEAARKRAEAKAFIDAKQSGTKMPSDQANALALIETEDEREAEIRAREKARRVQGLLDSVEQAINARKHMDKAGGEVNLPGR